MGNVLAYCAAVKVGFYDGFYVCFDGWRKGDFWGIAMDSRRYLWTVSDEARLTMLYLIRVTF
jgi:hypothetical protein